MINKKNTFYQSNIITFHGSFNENNKKANILLLLPRTSGPFRITKFKELIEKKFNLLEYDGIQSEISKTVNKSDAITIENKALALNNGISDWGSDNFHIVCHSTGCGLGTFLEKINEKIAKVSF